jgi:Aluminium activated malate transporter
MLSNFQNCKPVTVKYFFISIASFHQQTRRFILCYTLQTKPYNITVATMKDYDYDNDGNTTTNANTADIENQKQQQVQTDDDDDDDVEQDIRKRIHELSKRIDDDLFLEKNGDAAGGRIAGDHTQQEEDDNCSDERNPSKQSKNKTAVATAAATTTATNIARHLETRKETSEQPSPRTPKKTATSTTTTATAIDPDSWYGRARRVVLCQLGWDRDTFVWSLRLSIGLTIASLFVLLDPTSGFVYPEGIWVYITVAIVTWQPRTDVATVFTKCVRRLQGTAYSATLGVLVGYISYVIYQSTGQNRTAQALFIGGAVAVYGFVHSYIVDRIGLRDSYATTLASFTFGLALFGFLDHDQPWLSGTMRVVNVIVGIILSCVIAVTVFPLSTQTMVQQNVKKLVKLTGESVDLIIGEAEMMLCDNIDGDDENTGARPPMSVMEKISTDAKDKVHAKYMQAVDSWKSCRALVPLLESDPFRGCSGTPEGHDQFSKKQRVAISRCFRIQVNAISIDSLCRANHILAEAGSQMLLRLHCNNDNSDTCDNDQDAPSSWLSHVRQNIRIIFDIDDEESTISRRQKAIRNLLQRDLTRLQEQLAVLQKMQYRELQQQQRVGRDGAKDETTSSSRSSSKSRNSAATSAGNNNNKTILTLERMMTPSYDNHPLRHASNGGVGQAILFLQLLEYLILRVAQFYVFWNRQYSDASAEYQYANTDFHETAAPRTYN